MANGSVMMETVNDIRDALGGDGSSPETVLNGSELMSTVLEIKDLVESGGGGGGGGLVVTITATDDTATMDKSYREITTAINSGLAVNCLIDDEFGGKSVSQISAYGFNADDNEYYVEVRFGIFVAATQDDSLVLLGST